MWDLLFGGHAAWFTVPALVGTGLFIIRLVLMLAGGHAGDMDFDAGIDADHGDPGSAFKALSVQSIIGFAMGFGWAALGMHKGGGYPPSISAIVGVVGGVGMVWLLAVMLKGMHDLQSSGNIPIQEALGREGSVYVSVPERGGGTGQVRVVISNRARILNAVSEAEGIPSNAAVRVTKVNADNTVTVAAV